MTRTTILAVTLLMLGACRTPQPATTTATSQVLSGCLIDGDSAQEFYQCDADFDNFVYTAGTTSHVFEQTENNLCVWVSSMVPDFHLTSTPIGEDSTSLHVTFHQGNVRCPVIISGTECSSAPDSGCTDDQKDIAINACIGFAVACAAQ
jgi:hypothetical protein